MAHKPLLIDVMIGDRFVCQLRYTKRGFPAISEGKIIERHDSRDIERFVYEQRPSLKGKKIRIEFSVQKVINH